MPSGRRGCAGRLVRTRRRYRPGSRRGAGGGGRRRGFRRCPAAFAVFRLKVKERAHERRHVSIGLTLNRGKPRSCRITSATSAALPVLAETGSSASALTGAKARTFPPNAARVAGAAVMPALTRWPRRPGRLNCTASGPNGTSRTGRAGGPDSRSTPAGVTPSWHLVTASGRWTTRANGRRCCSAGGRCSPGTLSAGRQRSVPEIPRKARGLAQAPPRAKVYRLDAGC